MLEYIPERSDKREITHILFYNGEYTQLVVNASPPF